ncbi:lysosomal aspartic protease-like [Nasonia vitripennis]|uniref:Peptidase A1 domain-containing protein n=1 Tax=Nasonia vitripennis TaxID=7425 RepID=A0A7M7G666_NASVI|nr:lysosomal aspartic protease-like [Nasonia vitripennis]
MKNFCFTGLLLAVLAGIVAGRIEFDLYREEPTLETISRSKRSLHEHKAAWKNDSVVLYKFMNGEYYGTIGVGSSSKPFKVIFDTTWADSWLPSSHCGWTEIACKLHNQYDSSESSSYFPNGEFINLTSSELSLMGILSTDTFHLAHVKVVNQTFLEATHMSLNPFLQYKADGIVGLAYQEQSGWKGVTPFFYNMIRQKLVQEHVFTFYMNRDATTPKAGKVILGGRQRSHMKEDTLTVLNVVEKKFWMIQMDSMFAEKNKTNYPICEKCRAIFDSSSNTIVGPPNDILKLNYMLNAVYVPGINRYTVNCRNYAKLPKIHFVLKGNDFVIQSKYYVQRLTLENIEACFSPFVPNANATEQTWELGGAFMMEFYTEFDFDNNVVNIAETIF